MPKASKGKKFYAVQKGRQTGVFLTWEDCEKQTKGYAGAKYQSFTNAADAEAFVSGTLSKNSGPSATSTSNPSGGVVLNSKGKKRVMSKDVADESQYDIVYCDGACKGNGQAGSIAGVGVWWEEDDPRNIAERCPGDQTNNRAELIAIVRMLETTPKSTRPLLIKTDSQYCIKCFFQWLPKWKRNNFRTAGGDPVKNVEIIKYVSALLEVRALVGQPVRMEYVKGHSGDRGNDGADAQANKGALLPPVPERNWAKAKQELLERSEKERRLNEDKPAPMPLNVDTGVLEPSTNQLPKVRKDNHGLPFSRLSSIPASTEPRNSEPLSMESPASLRLPSPSHVTPSPPPLPIIEVSSSPPKEPAQIPLPPSPPLCNAEPTQPEPEPENVQVASHMDSQSSSEEPNKPPVVAKTPVRKHGVGLFTTTPPPNAFVNKFLKVPSEFHEIKESESVLQDQLETPEKPDEKPMAMGVDDADVDLNSQEAKESVPQDQEENQKPDEKPMAMSVDDADIDLNSQEAKEPESVPQDYGKTEELDEKPIAMSVDVADVDLNSQELKVSESVPQEQEKTEKPNEKPMAMSVDVADVDLNSQKSQEARELESVPQDHGKTEEPDEKFISMSVDVADIDLNSQEVKVSGSVPQEQEKTEKPNEKPMAMSVDVADVGLNSQKSQEARELESVPQDHGKTEEPDEKFISMSVDVADVDLNSQEIEVSESVPQDQERTEKPNEKPMVMSVDVADVDLNSQEVKVLESVPHDQEETEKLNERPMAMCVDVADVDLNDYLDCVDDDDDIFYDAN